ncbi:glutathione peroxidase [Mucilaginibacter myungsuensis]|uniref:Glutathione peroxidase n=1 Tax=Mucilaginibacter myungsuensis TaxID=649104 RepID=A0A929L2E3_9SPHI|nr:glutathione peroxidase [Mucilaginibacter myungsuensis]MBE9663239.1 glutathione peroxidase [Mucilaginibacter myungsuensis]MDN3598872.1 glutathione peroxidase [Mucilaginibacter myungsuensis]
MDEQSIYRFSVKKLNGEEVSLGNFKDKVLLIVNTASQCGFTPQLKELEELRKAYKDKDFEILAFPSNDFGGQEPLNGSAIGTFCAINFGTHFPLFEKMRVRGPHSHPLFRFLADKKQNGRVGSAPRWNFHKYLVDTHGQVTDFFYPFTKPTSSKIRKKIDRLLAAGDNE